MLFRDGGTLRFAFTGEKKVKMKRIHEQKLGDDFGSLS
jgi:hypothetical protein